MGFIYEPGQGMTEPQIKQGNRLLTNFYGRSTWDHVTATDDVVINNIANDEATAGEVSGQGDTAGTFRVSALTGGDTTSTVIGVDVKFLISNNGAASVTTGYVVFLERGVGASPSSWTNLYNYRTPNLAVGNYHAANFLYLNGVSVQLTRDTRYTYRLRRYALVATGDITYESALSARNMTAWIQHF